MGNEYRLSYTASEIDEKLGKVDDNAQAIDTMSKMIADKAILENNVVKFYKTATIDGESDIELFSIDISSVGGTGELDLENLTLSIAQNGEYQRLSMSDGTTTKYVDIPMTTITDEQVQIAVTSYLDAHPEAVTSVEDGSVTVEKLDYDMREKMDTLSESTEYIYTSDELVAGTYIDSSGVEKERSTIYTSGFVPYYNPQDVTEISGNLGFWASMNTLSFYDIDKTFISGITTTKKAFTVDLSTVPENTAYIRFSAFNSNGVYTDDYLKIVRVNRLVKVEKGLEETKHARLIYDLTDGIYINNDGVLKGVAGGANSGLIDCTAFDKIYVTEKNASSGYNFFVTEDGTTIVDTIQITYSLVGVKKCEFTVPDTAKYVLFSGAEDFMNGLTVEINRDATAGDVLHMVHNIGSRLLALLDKVAYTSNDISTEYEALKNALELYK